MTRTLQKFFNNQQTGLVNCELPHIDFDNRSLLGYYTTGGCEVKYIREVINNESEKKYHYKIIVKNCGTCKKESYSYNWSSAPKIPEGWNVTFEIAHK